MSIGKRIAERRNEIHMTQEQLADSLGVSYQSVSSWENDKNLPETERLVKIAKALSTKVSWLLEEEEIQPSRWELHDAMFSTDNMYKKVREYALARDMKNTGTALRIMKKYHEGQTRKGKDKVPYISHPLMLACHAIALRIADDDLLAACLLHDVLEDTEATEADLQVDPEIIEAVKLVSFEKSDDMTKEEKEAAKALYYQRISGNRIASMVKLLDRCCNISCMATGFTRQRMAEYIDETEKYIMPILDLVKHEYDEYYNTAFLLKYQLKSVMESLKRTL